MKSLPLIAMALCLVFAGPSPAVSADDGKAQPKCEVGPVPRTFGDTSWLVYGCDDDQSLIIATAPGNPAAPFYFTFFLDGGHYHLHGEGTGSKAESEAAYKEIQNLTLHDIQGLIATAKTQQKPVE